MISGGAGHDFVWGGTGADRFLLAPGDGIDLIVDFAVAEDKILLPNLEFEDITISERFGNAVVSLTATGERLGSLLNVSAAELTAANFASILT